MACGFYVCAYVNQDLVWSLYPCESVSQNSRLCKVSPFGSGQQKAVKDGVELLLLFLVVVVVCVCVCVWMISWKSRTLLLNYFENSASKSELLGTTVISWPCASVREKPVSPHSGHSEWMETVRNSLRPVSWLPRSHLSLISSTGKSLQKPHIPSFLLRLPLPLHFISKDVFRALYVSSGEVGLL